MKTISINGRLIGPGHPTYIVAELSANHNGSLQQAEKLIAAAKEAGADAVKLQTYTPDTITLDCDNDYFRLRGTLYDGRTLYDLYQEAHTPWEWQPHLMKFANGLGLDLFSSPFDGSAVDFLETMNCPAYKISSSELIDWPLLERAAKTGKPVILSTGMATLAEIDEAVRRIRGAGDGSMVLLHCVTTYPARPEEMNLRTIPHMAEAFGVPVGLSDHSLGGEIPIAAVTLGANMIEKHFILSREDHGPDSVFSMEPAEFKAMVDGVRAVEQALGVVRYGLLSERERVAHNYRRSLFIAADMVAGEVLTEHNVRSVRPGHGLHPGLLPEVLGCRIRLDVKKGTPLRWEMIERVGR
ncbi:MAG: pseudaminic acid synthase [Magnetococcales bacterium]|nr:pseudaminic acid synthase [Magnetococcales bacterium]